MVVDIDALFTLADEHNRCKLVTVRAVQHLLRFLDEPASDRAMLKRGGTR